MANSVRERFIGKIRQFKEIEAVPKLSSVYTTFNEMWLDVRYSGMTKGGYYWFYVDTYRVNEWKGQRRFIECLICADENTVLMVPDDVLFKWCGNLKPNRKGHWLLRVIPRDGELILRVTGRSPINLKDYINRYDFISQRIPRPIDTGVAPSGTAPISEEVDSLILANQELQGDSLHDKVVDTLYQIGGWMGYTPRKSYKVRPESPYEIDVVWLRNDLLDVAVEVQVSGSEAEAKDRLIHARRFGARKIVVVSTPKSIPRLKSICRYEPDLKNWLEVWSFGKVYRMFLAGREFFELFRPFERQEWSEEIREVL